MYRYCYLLILFPILLLGCHSTNEADGILEKAIAQHGGSAYDDLHVSFQFREISYGLKRSGGQFVYSRSFEDSLGIQHDDTLSNNGFFHWEDGKAKMLSSELMLAKEEALNSVMYFALLPQPLADEAVIAEYLGVTQLEGQQYHKVSVTFDEKGGGTDFQDVFLYWFRTDNHALDFLAYTYEVEEGGARFRKAVNQREVGGIVWNDYINYKAPKENEQFNQVDSLYSAGALDSLSFINLTNMKAYE